MWNDGEQAVVAVAKRNELRIRDHSLVCTLYLIGQFSVRGRDERVWRRRRASRRHCCEEEWTTYTRVPMVRVVPNWAVRCSRSVVRSLRIPDFLACADSNSSTTQQIVSEICFQDVCERAAIFSSSLSEMFPLPEQIILKW